MLIAVEPMIVTGDIDDVLNKLTEEVKHEVNRQLNQIRRDTGIETDGMKIRIRYYYDLKKTFVTVIEELA